MSAGDVRADSRRRFHSTDAYPPGRDAPCCAALCEGPARPPLAVVAAVSRRPPLVNKSLAAVAARRRRRACTLVHAFCYLSLAACFAQLVLCARPSLAATRCLRTWLVGASCCASELSVRLRPSAVPLGFFHILGGPMRMRYTRWSPIHAKQNQ